MRGVALVHPYGARNTCGEIMKATRKAQRRDVADVRPEYRFDVSLAKPSRFAPRMKRPAVAVVLDAVAAVFDSSAKVNAQLRSAIAARKRRKPQTRARARNRRAGRLSR
jgi:hypothetical protein